MIPPYSPAALRALIARIGLSQRDAAAMLGVHERTFRRWIADQTLKSHSAMPDSAWRLLNIIANDFEKEKRR